MLSIGDLTVRDDRGHDVVRDVSFEVRAGEIFGIAGVAGNGQDELVEAWWLAHASSGTVTLDGTDTTGASPRTLHKMGLGFFPATGIALGWC